jgi:N-acetylglucosaminyldiphosphoundecaprenol N-acetyl-beta-D-mannosaminyltransferase
MIRRVRESKPDILLVALGQPRGEIWLARNRHRLGVPVSVQLGASFDFVVGKAARSPAWIQRLGMEWLHRLSREPTRLGPRYVKNACFLAHAILRDLLGRGA